MRKRTSAIIAADQALYSLSNFALTFGVARKVGVHEFGSFSLVFAGMVTVLALSRSVAGENISLGGSTSKHVLSAGFTSATILGVLAAALALFPVLSLAPNASWAPWMLSAFLVAPAQDAGRYIAVTRSRPKTALLADLVWLLFPAIALALDADAGLVAAAYTVGCGASTAVLWSCSGTGLASAKSGILWLRETRSEWSLLAIEAVVSALAMHAALISMTIMHTTAGAAALKGVQTLFAPVNLLIAALTSLNLSQIRLGLDHDPESTYKNVMYYTAAVAGSALVGIAFWLAIGPERISIALGATSPLAYTIIIPVGLVFFANGLAAGPVALLRATTDLVFINRLRVLVGIFNVAGIVVGALVAGISGSAWGLTIANTLGLVAWVRRARSARATASAPLVVLHDTHPQEPERHGHK